MEKENNMPNYSDFIADVRRRCAHQAFCKQKTVWTLVREGGAEPAPQ